MGQEHIKSKNILQPLKYLIIIINQFRFINQLCRQYANV